MKSDRRKFLKIMSSSAITAAILPLYVSCGEKSPQPEVQEDTQKNKVEEALTLMQKYGSCCTGVLAAYAEEFGLKKELAARLGRGMAGGIGGTGNVCGAVSGAVLVIGLKTTNKENLHDMEAGYKTMETVSKFVTRFKERHTSIKCRELIGHDISTPEKRVAAMKDNAYANCPKFVESAVTILDDIFKSERT